MPPKIQLWQMMISESKKLRLMFNIKNLEIKIFHSYDFAMMHYFLILLLRKNTEERINDIDDDGRRHFINPNDENGDEVMIIHKI
ncbi:hypothetical protein H5410_001214 [Solanum commersonii]|uniref:Uncharacterized protein n=1 Tax=Solanum commersonii TaxID=4109 RepID=A0A9J6AYL2_SOLCO|nr:hypothetical protein H5410_001214 [Solanum commersonii]